VEDKTMADEVSSQVSVVIAGAGPVGLALAIELGLRGVHCLVVDETDGQIRVPTANLLNCRTVEHLRRWGIADTVRYHGFKRDYPNTVLYVTALKGYELARFEHPANQDAHGLESPESPLWCPKAYFDPILRQKVADLPCVHLRFGSRLESFEQTDSCVIVRLIDVASQAREQVRADYLVGCDGGRSRIRHQLDIKLRGYFAQQRQMLVWFKASLLEHGLEPAVMTWILKHGGFAMLSALDGDQLWRTGPWLPESNEHTPEEWVRLIIGDDVPFEVVGSGYWGGHYAVADRYRDQRVFLAGDAAHLLIPAGAFGMNLGIGDAVDLGWKIAATLAGWAGLGLLDSYEQERRAIALQTISSSSQLRREDDQLERLEQLEANTDEGQRLRQQLGQSIQASGRGQEFRTRTPGLVLGYSYENSPICESDGTPLPAFDPNSYSPSARPGARAPHLWLSESQSTLDLFGQGFTLLKLDRLADSTGLEKAAQDCHLPIQVFTFDRVDLRKVYEKCLVLVRPDGHVAWRGDEVPKFPHNLLDKIRGAVLSHKV
jgi:2-polyprenyl-6-methoxyphenol hydroxylase-like FAD-dependent oxidoreductase